MRKTLLALAIAGGCTSAVHADEWFIEAHYPDHAALVRGAALFQHVIVDAERQVLRVDTDDEGIRQLEDAGLSVSVDAADTARLRAFYARMQDAIQSRQVQETEGGYPGIPGYACYRTVEGTYQTMDDLAATQPGLAEIHAIGPSWQKTQNSATGYDMRTLRVTNLATAAADPDRPKMVVFGSIHAREYTPAELLTRMAEWLVSGYGTDPEATWLVDHVDFRFVLQANPDGRKKAETGISWRKNTDTTNGFCSGTPGASSQPGIDLNRNFPFHWNTTGGQGSSGTKCNLTYRGPTAASEPETQNLVGYVAGTPGGNGTYSGGALPDRRPDDVSTASPDDYAGLFFDIHSYSQLVLWPWGDTPSAAPNRTPLQTFGRRLAWFNDYTPEQSDSLYPTDGATDDNFYGTLGVPAYTIELGVQFFESCSTFTSTTYPKNFAALRYAARAAAAPYRLPTGPDAYGITATTPTTGAGGLYTTVSATIDDLRYNQTNGTQTTFTVRAANAYVDRLPWQAGAVAISLSASDGVFNGKTETVGGDVALAGLAPGRHIIYVQGVNTAGGGSGTPGTPNAVFVDVPQAPTMVIATPQIVGNGSIDPSTPQSVTSGSTLAFTLTPGVGQHTGTVGGCPGTFAAPVFTAGPLVSNCTLTATFEPDQFTIGGTVSGLAGAGLTLSLNGSTLLPVPASATGFAFPGTLPYGSPYDVTIEAVPPNQACTITRGSGTVEAQVSDIAVSCGPDANDIIFRNGFDPSMP
ncbi:M14 family zinc carboxypeptidase [Dokdonella sp.]|uniref:M14 family zinc carboxypeptidase n=1 Tax=Dokdonella sp. TaxID=2291710 RepID=UPI00378382CE